MQLVKSTIQHLAPVTLKKQKPDDKTRFGVALNGLMFRRSQAKGYIGHDKFVKVVGLGKRFAYVHYAALDDLDLVYKPEAWDALVLNEKVTADFESAELFYLLFRWRLLPLTEKMIVEHNRAQAWAFFFDQAKPRGADRQKLVDKLHIGML